MKAFGLDINQIQNGGGVSGKAGTTLFGNQIGGTVDSEFASLMDILGGGNTAEGAPNLLEILTAAKENPEALTQLPKEVLQFIGQEFRFDGQVIMNDQGKPIQVEDILAKIKEIKPELLNTDMPTPKIGKEAEVMEVRNLLKGHDLGFDNPGKKAQPIFTTGDDFVQTKEASQQSAGAEVKKSFFPNSKNKTAFSQYGKEAKILENNLISNTPVTATQVEMPQAAVGMTQFRGTGSELGLEMLTTQQKTVDLNHINPSNTSSLIDQVSKLIEQNNIKSADSMDVIIKHDELGQFKIEVNKNTETNQLDLRIISKDKAGHNFFVENETQLVKTLNQSGIKLGTFKVALSSEGVFNSNNDSGRNFSEGFSQNRGQQGHFSGHQGENADSQRRRQLWQAFKDNAEYASA